MGKFTVTTLAAILAVASAYPTWTSWTDTAKCSDFCKTQGPDCMSLAATGEGLCYTQGPMSGHALDGTKSGGSWGKSMKSKSKDSKDGKSKDSKDGKSKDSNDNKSRDGESKDGGSKD